jgi:hypothetical protein
MENYVAVIFDSDKKASEGLHTLWRLDVAADVTVHGTAVIHRDASGHVDVASKETDPAPRRALGVGIGALRSLGNEHTRRPRVPPGEMRPAHPIRFSARITTRICIRTTTTPISDRRRS